MNFAGGVLNIQSIASDKEALSFFNTLNTVPRHKKWRMKCPEQKHRIQIHTRVGKNDPNDVAVIGQKVAEGCNWRVVNLADGPTPRRIPRRERVPACA